MLHKVKKYLRRSGALLVALVLLVSFVVVPVNAADTSSDTELIDLLDYGFVSNGNGVNNVVGVGYSPFKLSFDYPYPGYLSYVDFVFEYNGVPTKVMYSATGEDLTLVKVSDNVYRAYGYVKQNSGDHMSLYISSSTYGTLQALRCVVSLARSAFVSEPIGGALTLYSSGFSEDLIIEPGEPDYLLFTNEDVEIPLEFNAMIWPDNSNAYDYIDILFYFFGYGVDTLSVTYNDIVLPFDVSYVTPGDVTIGQQYVTLRIYMDGIERIDGVDPLVKINGTYAPDAFSSGFYIEAITGYLSNSSLSPTFLYWLKFKNFLTDLFGGNDNSADNALITQEEINVSVNNQLVGAVEDWNTHIEVVETGYDMAFTQTTPALNWIASLANGIYSGLGWFGRLYLLIGLVSVFMLVLSKSGLARKIGSGIRRGG